MGNVMSSHDNQSTGEILLYQTEDGATKIDVRLKGETIWLTQAQMAELFQKDKRTISEHIANIYEEKELSQQSTVRNFRAVQKEGNRDVERNLATYNLDIVISVGYRVKSHRGTQFRIWATQRLKEYLVKGFILDDMRLKQTENGNYFDELLARIRDIRSSEKVFWRKVLDIYATSIDYTRDAETSKQFFKVIQNKMHWAAHGKTAAEVIAARADATKPSMGLTSWTGNKLLRADVEVAKNYLNKDELDLLNRLVSMYLDYAELQAMNRKPMYMNDWIVKLDDFIRFNEKELLTHAGKISHQEAIDKAYMEYDKYCKLIKNESSIVEQHFTEALEITKKLGKNKKTSKNE